MNAKKFKFLSNDFFCKPYSYYISPIIIIFIKRYEKNMKSVAKTVVLYKNKSFCDKVLNLFSYV